MDLWILMVLILASGVLSMAEMAGGGEPYCSSEDDGR